MKKSIPALIVVIIFTALVVFSCATVDNRPEPPVVGSQKVKMAKKTLVSLEGSGYTPGQAIKIVVDIDGVMSNIADSLKPELKVNESGAWKTTWNCSRLIKRKLIKEGAYVLTVTDNDYTPLAKTSIEFYK